jgi:hypothetical protein
VAQRIALSHGGSISHKSEKISDYNVPLIKPYLEIDFEGKDIKLIPKLVDELKRLQDMRIYNDIVALEQDGRLKYGKPTHAELTNSIFSNTWKVTFEVILPPKES